jgi:hypothetical protein
MRLNYITHEVQKRKSPFVRLGPFWKYLQTSASPPFRSRKAPEQLGTEPEMIKTAFILRALESKLDALPIWLSACLKVDLLKGLDHHKPVSGK